MRDLELPFGSVVDDIPAIVPARKLLGKVTGLYVAALGHFGTSARDSVELTLDGIPGDIHAGRSRRASSREPWYPRGVEIANDRQVSIVATDELASVAAKMGIVEIRPEWIGANMLIDGVPMLSMLPPGAQLFFRRGATLLVRGQNAPCQVAGRAIAEQAGMSNHAAGQLAFPKAAQRQRGLVAWVEKAGQVMVGDDVSVRVPEQWIYRP